MSSILSEYEAKFMVYKFIIIALIYIQDGAGGVIHGWVDINLCTLLGGHSWMRFCRQEFGEFPRLVGRYCSYLQPK